jgi:hypothetical protein
MSIIVEETSIQNQIPLILLAFLFSSIVRYPKMEQNISEAEIASVLRVSHDGT